MYHHIGTPKGLIPAYRHIQDTHRIMYLEGHGNYSLIYIQGLAQPLLVSRTIKYFEPDLPHFIRVSKALLINPTYIQGVHQVRSRSVSIELTNKRRLAVARRRIDQVLIQLGVLI
ncbi:LytTR family DNA-binding domain-containing protein [Spirosoma endophyticum]|uniref:LytTr DNA-binding domain-containing protein n=1 Tax=Spirosoma endophyticum TaxID=662367 RepID=A0A1I2E5M0_9BACT|nr:LytTR family DNA-binding domain-containing protein [Spirosoma endophyticum]SFE87973.1 LytTr DNA-binding domain-containing protein [Spirosoma endophyticum]